MSYLKGDRAKACKAYLVLDSDASRDPLHEESDLATIRHESSGLARAGPRDPALKSFDYS